MKAILMLEDGKIFSGEALNAVADKVGEVIFNTAVVGYQEMLTDPANAGKILVLTYPLIGNYGVAPKFNQSKEVWPCGLVIKEKTRIFSNWQAKGSFDNFIKEHGLSVISGVDTRSLAVHIRQKGHMLGIISTSCLEPRELLKKIEAFKKNEPVSLLPKISVAKPAHLGQAKGKRVGVLDLGVTSGTVKQLEALGLSLTILPFDTTAEEISRMKLRGLVISSGPEEDTGLPSVANNIKGLLGKLPILGISCGHQVLARALGVKVNKMKVGHHGVNYPINNPATYRGEITVQNHSCVVDADSLRKIKQVKITGYNLNDRTVEEMESKKLKFIGVQYYPASPGFSEVNSTFKKFVKLLK